MHQNEQQQHPEPDTSNRPAIEPGTKMAIIVTGNPVDGFEFYGPFSTPHEAVEFANNDAHLDDSWHVADLHPVEPRDRQESGV